MNTLEHAKNELADWLSKPNDDPDKWLADGVLELLEVFANQGHSGSSAPYMVKMFCTLALHEPIKPLTGEEDEWVEILKGSLWQNKRCSHVFKDSSGTYDIDGKVFLYPDGETYTSSESRVYITFPYYPTQSFIPVDEDGDPIK